ncbi:N-acetylglucosaminyl-phosphatidylinositol de-N-acetylase [Binucleata daphniae]
MAKHIQKMYIADFELQKGKFLLVIAHPDDEIMFFTPLLQNVKEQITILCLSNGNYYGQGKMRAVEMQNVCNKINIPHIISNNFCDNKDWNVTEIANYITNLHFLCNFDVIFTFDSDGVSGHKNHRSCFLGVQQFRKNVAMPVYYLKSQSIFAKYFFKFRYDNTNFATKQYIKGIGYMLLYKSQMKWFRYLYLATSNYMLFNEFVQEKIM